MEIRHFDTESEVGFALDLDCFESIGAAHSPSNGNFGLGTTSEVMTLTPAEFAQLLNEMIAVARRGGLHVVVAVEPSGLTVKFKGEDTEEGESDVA